MSGGPLFFCLTKALVGSRKRAYDTVCNTKFQGYQSKQTFTLRKNLTDPILHLAQSSFETHIDTPPKKNKVSNPNNHAFCSILKGYSTFGGIF